MAALCAHATRATREMELLATVSIINNHYY